MTPTPSPNACDHPDFVAVVCVNPLADTAPMRFSADVRIRCARCGLPFRFLGLPCGLDLNGAAVSVDGETAALAIAPLGQVVTPLDGVTGFTVRRENERKS